MADVDGVGAVDDSLSCGGIERSTAGAFDELDTAGCIVAVAGELGAQILLEAEVVVVELFAHALRAVRAEVGEAVVCNVGGRTVGVVETNRSKVERAIGFAILGKWLSKDFLLDGRNPSGDTVL